MSGSRIEHLPRKPPAIRLDELVHEATMIGAIRDEKECTFADFRIEKRRSGFHENRDRKEMFTLSVDTVNGTAWSSIRAYLTTTSANVVLAQAH